MLEGDKEYQELEIAHKTNNNSGAKRKGNVNDDNRGLQSFFGGSYRGSLRNIEQTRPERKHRYRAATDPLDLKDNAPKPWEVPVEELSKEFENLVISNDYCQLYVTSIDREKSIIEFHYQETTQGVNRTFKFDFRYYRPFTDPFSKRSGIYAFKTYDIISRSFPHKLTDIRALNSSEDNHRTQQIIITYQNEMRELTQVRVIMRESFEQSPFSGCEPLEFDVDFAGLPYADMDATINFRASEFANNQTFYTDSNGLGTIKRKRKQVNNNGAEARGEAPANYYPINSQIFIENYRQQEGITESMLVMNDRPMGGTGFRKGCIELMFNRRGSSNDDLGMPEGVNEYFNGLPVRTHHRYLVKFVVSREELYNW